MTKHERLLISLGATYKPSKRHKVYVLHGVRFSLHRGSNRSNDEERQVRGKLLRLQREGKIECDFQC